jgi:copper chaperone CopZ
MISITVTYDPTKVTIDEIAQAVRQAGYGVGKVSPLE